MKIAIITLSIEHKNTSAYYNSQAEGLAKALVRLGVETCVYHMVPDLPGEEEAEIKEGVTIIYHRCKKFGKNAYPKLSRLRTDVDAYITASDNDTSFPVFYKWCQKNKIYCLPYVGVIQSNNANRLKRMLMDSLCQNEKYYRKMTVAVKTRTLMETMKNRKIKDTVLTPVGLDETVLYQSYENADKESLRAEFGFSLENKILLFIGRMTPEKDPFLMLQIMKELYDKDNSYRLLMIGKGELFKEVKEQIVEYGLLQAVILKEQVPNQNMWEMYRMSDCYVNLNTHEIFGMSILEAMYYECPVVAMHALGPDDMIVDGECGYLCDSKQVLIDRIESAILDSGQLTKKGKIRVKEHYMWEHSAKILMQLVENKGTVPGSKKGI